MHKKDSIANLLYLQYDSFDESKLRGFIMTNTNVIYQAKLHWILFFWPIVLMIGALIITLQFETIRFIGFFLGVFALAWILVTWITYHFSSLTIKKKQVILRTGMLVRQTIDIPLAKIESIDIRQSLPGSILQYGAIVITGTGGTRHRIDYLSKPLTCRRYIEQLMHA